MGKPFKLSKQSIRTLAPNYGGCIASDLITVEGRPVRFMYREKPNNPLDSGWRFTAGLEDDAYMDDPENHAVYDVNTIANYDPSIVPLLDSPSGSAFEKRDDVAGFVEVTDWALREED
jgi:hypothetical protein